MADLLLLLTMFVVGGGIGLPIAELLPSSRFAWRLLLAPVMGYSALAVIALVAYRFGVSVPVIFGSAAAAAALVLAWRGPSLVRRVVLARGPERHATRVVTIAFVAATLILILPRWVGGDQFAVFQGNHWDTHAYLESAVVYARRPYAAITDVTDDQIRRNPLYDVAQVALTTRPSVQLLYCVFTRVAPGQTYRLYYAYLVGCLAQLVLVVLFIARNVVPGAPLLEITAMALVYPLGFWGQYVFDINAWSQTAAAPGLLLMTGLLIHSAVVTNRADSLAATLRLTTVLAVIIAGAVYLYPEALLIYAAAVVPVAAGILTVKLLRRSISLTSFVPLAGFASVATALLYTPLVGFLIGQLAYGSRIKVSWWQIFQSFFLGRDNVVGSSVEFVIDFAAGLFGLYFATPGPRASALTAGTLRVAIVVSIIGLLVALGVVVSGRATLRGQDPRPHETRQLLAAWAAALMMLLLPAIYFAWQGNYWPAGKALSYATPVLMLLLALPIAYEFGPRWRRPLRWIVCGFIIFQAGSGVTRIAAAARPNGIHYNPPYPALQARELKTGLGWDFQGLERLLTPRSHVLIRRMDIWLDRQLMVFLWCRGIPFVREAEFVTGFGAGRNLGALPATKWPNVEISASGRELLVQFQDGRPDVRVATADDFR